MSFIPAVNREIANRQPGDPVRETLQCKVPPRESRNQIEAHLN